MTRRFPLAAMCGLAACTAGPDYHLPDNATANRSAANAPFLSGSEPAYVQAPVPDHWWELYQDPRLSGYVAEALAANTDLRAADANLRRATFVVREAEAARLPATSLSAETGLARLQGSTARLPGAAGYGLGGSVAYPLDLASGIRRGIEAARANSEAVQAARDQVRVTVAAAVTRSYAAACSANATLEATQRVLDIQRQTLAVTERLFRGGRGTAFDVTRASAAADQSAAAIPAIIADRQASLFELAALMGRVPTDYPRETEACAAPPRLVHRLPVGDGAALIRRRADIRSAERSLAAATAVIGVEIAQLYPLVSLGGSAGFGGPIAGISSGSQFSVNLGPLLSWSFPNRSLARARIAEAGAGAEAASAQFDGTVVEALRQAESALSAYAGEIGRNRDLALTRDAAAEAADQAGKLFRFGRTGFLDLVSAQAGLANAQAALANSNALLIDRQIDVFLALGGGWS